MKEVITQTLVSRVSRRYQIIGICLLVVSALSLGIIGYEHMADQSVTIPLTISTTPNTPAPVQPILSWQHHIIQPGDTLSDILLNQGATHHILQQIMDLALAKTYLTNLQVGHQLSFAITNQATSLTYDINDATQLVVTPTAKGYKAQLNKSTIEHSTQYLSGTIHGTFAESARRAGLNQSMIAAISKIMGAKINFSKALHRGDHFAVLYQADYVKGKKIGDGPVLAVSLSLQGHPYTAIRFKDQHNNVHYYDVHGDSLQPAFLVAPVHYTRISSHFTYHRFDPILHRDHPHLGVDYAAPEGTPIRALGDGVVRFAGHKGGYGNAVIIQYGPHIKTLYGHMEHFARHLHAYEHVNRGEIVGYVGSTGWSTGPHLHFSIYINGVAKDPLKVKLPHAYHVAAQSRYRFQADVKKDLAQLAVHQSIHA